MVEHIVLLKLKSEVTPAQLETLSDILLGMKGEISGIESITAGTNNSPEGKSQGYTATVLSSVSETKRHATYIYHIHSTAKWQANIFVHLLRDVLVFDYQTSVSKPNPLGL